MIPLRFGTDLSAGTVFVGTRSPMWAQPGWGVRGSTAGSFGKMRAIPHDIGVSNVNFLKNINASFKRSAESKVGMLMQRVGVARPGLWAAAFGTAILIDNLFGAARKTINWKPVERQGGYSEGPGYISFSKTSGMPDNHLNTQGIGLSLSRLRHTSII